MDYFEQAQRYEVMSEVAKLLQPFYEDARDSKVHIYQTQYQHELYILCFYDLSYIYCVSMT